MSFSGTVKEELSKQMSTARHCQIAEIAAMLQFCGKVDKDTSGKLSIIFQTENLALARKYFTLLRKAFNIKTDIVSDEISKIGVFRVNINDSEQAENVLMAIKWTDLQGWTQLGVPSVLLKNSCCKEAFLRGAFLSIGSMSAPEKSYHLEFVCTNEAQAEQIQSMILAFDLKAKIVPRKKYFVVYLKEGEAIVELLNVMQAHVSLMELENTRIYKEVKNSVNRRVNCEMANISKMVNAASKQIEDIIYIRDHYGFQNISAPLRQMAEVRLEYPEVPLKELGTYLDPEVGKSGVNHRLRKLSELADKLRN